MPDVIAQLFPWLSSERLSTFSCGHIVPRSHVQTLCVTKGPAGSLLEFKYAQQTDQRLLGELGQLILNLCSVVPGGMIVFFPSYSSLNLAQKSWNTTQHMVKFGVKKTVRFSLLLWRTARLNVLQVFLEPHDSNGVESTLREYANAVKTLVRLKNASQVASPYNPPVDQCVRQEDRCYTLCSGWREALGGSELLGRACPSRYRRRPPICK